MGCCRVVAILNMADMVHLDCMQVFNASIYGNLLLSVHR